MIRSIAVTSVFFVFLSLLSTNTTEAVEHTTGCSSDLLSVVASIYRIEPPNLPVNVQSAKGAQIETRKIHDCLRAGEILTLQDKAQKVELFIKNNFVRITAGKPFNGTYKVPEGVPFSDKASAYIKAAVELFSITSSPLRTPTATGISRGDSDNDLLPSPRQPLRNIQTLRNLPTQQIASNTTAVLSWREGDGPWTCEGLAQDGATVTESESVSRGWCVIPKTERPLVRLLVKDARGDKIGWNVSTVSSAAIPRPEWINQPEETLSSADHTAWAIWVWRSAGPQWRLQALSMLNENSESSWLAGYVLNGILNDAPVVRTNEADVR